MTRERLVCPNHTAHIPERQDWQPIFYHKTYVDQYGDVEDDDEQYSLYCNICDTEAEIEEVEETSDV